MIYRILFALAYVVLAPFIGGFFEGIDRKLSARMQGRIGPSLFQPFYDVHKLLNKQVIGVAGGNQSMMLYTYMLLMILSGIIFFAGGDMLMSIFVLSTSSIFLYFSSMISSSPYNTIAASRELIQIMAYEPAVLLTCVGFYIVSGSFNIDQILLSDKIMIAYLPGFFVAFVFILTIKMRKSPFDVSSGHHAHQELVQGITTELGARNLAIYTVTEWYENVLLMGIVALFVLNRHPLSYLAAIVLICLVYFLEIFIDNVSARVKYTTMFKLSWSVTLLAIGVNLFILMLLR